MNKKLLIFPVLFAVNILNSVVITNRTCSKQTILYHTFIPFTRPKTISLDPGGLTNIRLLSRLAVMQLCIRQIPNPYRHSALDPYTIKEEFYDPLNPICCTEVLFKHNFADIVLRNGIQIEQGIKRTASHEKNIVINIQS